MDAFKTAKGIQTYVYHSHQQEFNHFIRAHKEHPDLEPFGGGLQGVWQPMFNNEQLLVLLIMMPVTTTPETTKPSDVIETSRTNAIRLVGCSGSMHHVT